DESAADDRQVDHGSRSAIGKRSNRSETASVRRPSAARGVRTAPVNASLNAPAYDPLSTGSSMRVSAQTALPSGGVNESETSGATSRGTQTIDASSSSWRANANSESRRAPVAASGT